MKNIQCVIYARKASYTNRNDLNYQIFDLERFANKSEIKVLEYFSDLSSGGTSNKRNDFYKMISLIENGKYNSIITQNLTTLSRNFYDSSLIINLLENGKLINIVTYSKNYTKKDLFEMYLAFGVIIKKHHKKSIDKKRTSI